MREEELYGLALCAGVGGLEMGIGIANPKFRTVAYVEREAFPASILAKRMEEGLLDPGPIWSDLETFDPEPWRGIVSVISCGFPCQPWSAAGKQKKTADSRWIWDSISEIICKIRPKYVFLENVPGVAFGGLECVLRTLAEVRLNAEWDLFRASDCGAPQKRERMFILGYPNRSRWTPAWAGYEVNPEEKSQPGSRGVGRELADSHGNGGGEIPPSEETERQDPNLRSEGLADSSGKSLRDQPGGSSGENGSGTTEFGNTSQGLADPDSRGLSKCSEQYSGEERGCEASSFGEYPDRCNEEMGDPNLEGLEGRSISERESSYQFPPWPPGPSEPSERFETSVEPSVCRTSTGLANRVDRLRACGNAVLPVVSAYAWAVLKERSIQQ
tara:strand:- start:2770 stop:3927 length:1158 start_codon:yes stop_codon:yes gene_type:complete